MTADHAAAQCREAVWSRSLKVTFIECTGESHGKPTVILATGRGLGSYHDWYAIVRKPASLA